MSNFNVGRISELDKSSLIGIAETLTEYLLNKGVRFTNDGFPIMKEEWYATTSPLVMATFNKRNRYHVQKQSISICYFFDDLALYVRLRKVFWIFLN